MLLASTNKPIADIAQEMGFCDQSYFSAVFHKLAGMTPAAYGGAIIVVSTAPSQGEGGTICQFQ